MNVFHAPILASLQMVDSRDTPPLISATIRAGQIYDIAATDFRLFIAFAGFRHFRLRQFSLAARQYVTPVSQLPPAPPFQL